MPPCTRLFAMNDAKEDPHHASRVSTRSPPGENPCLDGMRWRTLHGWTGGNHPRFRNDSDISDGAQRAARVPAERTHTCGAQRRHPWPAASSRVGRIAAALIVSPGGSCGVRSRARAVGGSEHRESYQFGGAPNYRGVLAWISAEIVPPPPIQPLDSTGLRPRWATRGTRWSRLCTIQRKCKTSDRSD